MQALRPVLACVLVALVAACGSSAGSSAPSPDGSATGADAADSAGSPDTSTADQASVPGVQIAKSSMLLADPKSVPAADIDALVAGNTAFGLAIYGKLAADKPGNLFVSPYSVSSALAMAWAGAAGTTSSEMASALHFTLDAAKLHPACNALEQALESRGKNAKAADGKGFRLNIANALWGQHGFAFLAPFLDTLAQNYGAGMNLVDFIADAEAARQTINAWVAQKTEGKITDLIPPGGVTADTRLVLTNAVYFNAAWATPFEVKQTKDGTFHAPGGDVPVPMMAQTEELQVAQTAAFTAVQLPYDGQELAMVLLLPTANDAQLANLTPEMLADVAKGMKLGSVSLTLPRFKFVWESSLVPALQALGMKESFSSSADFSGMDGKKDLFVTGVQHKAYVMVNEAGTEAAAATAVMVGGNAVLNPVAVAFDKPFLFYIQDIQTGAIVFLGRVVDPSK